MQRAAGRIGCAVVVAALLACGAEDPAEVEPAAGRGRLTCAPLCTPDPEVPVLTVTCDAVERTQWGECRLASNVSIRVTEWRFENDSLPARVVLRDSTGVGLPGEWGGEFVLGGRVTATAVTSNLPEGQAPDTLRSTGTLFVRARNWSTLSLGDGFRILSPNDLGEAPEAFDQLGRTFHALIYQETERWLGAMARVAEGPNQGMVALTGIPVRDTIAVKVNEAALREGSPFWLWQRSDPPPGPDGRPFCTRSYVLAPFLGLVRAHEGTGLELTSHAGIFRRRAQLEVSLALEGLVAKDERLLFRQGVPLARRADSLALAESQSMHDEDANNLTNLPCVFRGADGFVLPEETPR
jgi:hypothetical protein